LAKDLAKDFAVFAFIFKGLKWKFHQVHLLAHKLVGEVRIYSSNESIGAVTHPNINDIRANVLLAYRCERMS
jgi:hypothetical protein